MDRWMSSLSLTD